ncbi:dihydrofolate reductase family protein [Actinoplanes solisilvae]|uniref:dihydrofolate reductase family protein n=1 Tax=Actinoplanes solisilvae TaxID=2486853 RepID=UPI000FDC6C86|nr:dihydrofolate reductase family protein [Actinoplanes solisilvae]
MRKLVYYVASSLDGFIAAPDGSWDFFGPVHDDLGAFITDRYPETLPGAREKRVFDTVLMGRGTYEPALKAGVTSPYAHLDQYVFSSTIDPGIDPAVTVETGDPVAFVRELKQRPGRDIWLCGGGALAATLRDEIDEFVIKLNPVLAGNGIRLTTSPYDPRRLTLLEATPLGASGVVLLRYGLADG